MRKVTLESPDVLISSASPTASVADGLFLPEGASLFTRLRVALRCLEALQGNEGDPIAAPLLNACLDGGVYEKLSEKLLDTEEGRELIASRPTFDRSSLDLTALAQLPRGTLGCEYARYFTDNKIEPFESAYEVRNDVDYLSKRYRETHDIAHVLTGYGVDVVGEMEVQAFMVGNLGIRTGMLILAYSVFARKRYGLSLRGYARTVRNAYRRGVRSQPLIRVRYERYWEMPVETLRQELGIPPLTDR